MKIVIIYWPSRFSSTLYNFLSSVEHKRGGEEKDHATLFYTVTVNDDQGPQKMQKAPFNSLHHTKFELLMLSKTALIWFKIQYCEMLLQL